MKNTKKKILIGSCGGLTGVYLAKQFHRFDSIEICGFDANEDSVGRFFCDVFFILPLAKDSLFIPKLIDLLNKEKIDFYIPTHSSEIIEVSKYENIINKETKARFVVSPYETYLALDDKYIANEHLNKLGIPVPHIYTGEEENLKYPLLKKPRIGSGSNGVIQIKNKEEYLEALRDENSFLMEYLNGKEYTVDCLFDTNGNLLGYNQRCRNKCIGGAVTISKNDNSVDIKKYLDKMAQEWIFKGCVNFQYILVNEVPYFIDINLRYASGGLPLSVESGVDVPRALKKICFNEEIIENEFISDFSNRTMYRYFEEKFV